MRRAFAGTGGVIEAMRSNHLGFLNPPNTPLDKR
jgi:addiction module HigA family antidote